jgi:hypothetical protein
MLRSAQHDRSGSLLRNPSLFLDGHGLIGGQILELADDATRETDREPINLLRLTQAMGLKRILREIGGLAADFLPLLVASRLDLDFRAEAAPFALGAVEANLQPGTLSSPVRCAPEDTSIPQGKIGSSCGPPFRAGAPR